MCPEGKVCVVTGGASGISEATARAFTAAGARGVVVADVNEAALARVADEINALPLRADVSQETEIQALIRAAEQKYGAVDIFFSNAGISRPGHEKAPDAVWDLMWRIHVMSHVWAARALIPGMLERGSGYLLSTASAAGLLATLTSSPYTVTKHGAVALAESLAIQYADRGIRFSVLCPQSVRTGMHSGKLTATSADGVMEAEEVARIVLEAMDAERFLILSHEMVAQYEQRRVSNRDRWLAGMRRLRDRISSAAAA